jgi:hypothetical protein
MQSSSRDERIPLLHKAFRFTIFDNARLLELTRDQEKFSET